MIAVAAGHVLTAEAAFEALQAGGTAIDACVAGACTAFCAEPVLASPLGGGFLLHVPRTGRARLLDAFVHTPRRARTDQDLRQVEADYGTNTQTFQIGAGSIATSGLIPALFEAHAQAGRIPLSELLAPAVAAARKGVVQTAFQAQLSVIVGSMLTASPAARAIYAPEGNLLREGETLVNPDLADVLEVAGIEGARLFSHGEVAQALYALDGAHLTAEDLRRYQPQHRAPFEVTRAGQTILLSPAPSIGGLQIALALSAMPYRPEAAEIAEVLRATHDLRKTHGVRDDETIRAALRKTLAKRGVRQTGTTHISVLDREGNGAALTLSNGTGAGVIVPGTGIMPNNMLGEEDLLPDGMEGWTADTRLASAMCPASLQTAEGALTMLGSGGSNRIRTAIGQTLLNLTDHGMRLDDAIAAPRLHVDGAEPHLDVEGPRSEAALAALREHWPELTYWDQPSMYFGGVHAVRRDATGRQIEAAGDPRREGVALSGS